MRALSQHLAEDLDDDQIQGKSAHEGRFPVNVGITGYVAAMGEIVNIKNAYEDPRYHKFGSFSNLNIVT